MSSGNRILLLTPHPDDEVVGCAAAIARVQAGGAHVFTLYLTTGLPAREVAWPWQRAGHEARMRRRRCEALRAAARLGIYPLEFMSWPARQLKQHLDEAHALIESHLDATAADTIWTPAYEGGHQDHDVTNFLASQFRREVTVIEFAEYNAAWGGSSQLFPRTSGTETILKLSRHEAAAKFRALALYRSERKNLRHIGFARESFRPIGDYDYRRPPHPGRLFYQRFQWVPFRHPRVDFTSPAEVSAALAQFDQHSRGLLACAPEAV
jgi:LmbE family N-acetylglucosaminyl deacetylase